jgi:hypothetical protein
MGITDGVGDVADAADSLLRPGAATPHEKAAERIRKHISRRVRLRPRTRAILVFTGAILIIVSWLTPWYASLTWGLPSRQAPGTSNAGYELTNLSPGDAYAKYGLAPWFRTFTGRDLSSGPAALRSIAFSRTDFYTWVALAVLALIAIWTFERPRQGQLTKAARRRIYLAIESGKVILLVFIVARCVWKGFDLVNKATVNGLAQKALFGSPAPVAAHYVTNYSFGLTILPIGLILAALGVLSGDKDPDKNPKVMIDPAGIQVPVAQKIRVKAWALALIAILFIAVAYALFNG